MKRRYTLGLHTSSVYTHIYGIEGRNDHELGQKNKGDSPMAAFQKLRDPCSGVAACGNGLFPSPTKTGHCMRTGRGEWSPFWFSDRFLVASIRITLFKKSKS